jgi:hypothetical protein
MISENTAGHIEAVFGTGDILVSISKNPDTNVHESIFLEPNETSDLVGVQYPEKNGRKNSEISKGSIRLTFKKSKSVDVLLNYLVQVRDSLRQQESTSA